MWRSCSNYATSPLRAAAAGGGDSSHRKQASLPASNFGTSLCWLQYSAIFRSKEDAKVMELNSFAYRFCTLGPRLPVLSTFRLEEIQRISLRFSFPLMRSVAAHYVLQPSQVARIRIERRWTLRNSVEGVQMEIRKLLVSKIRAVREHLG